MMRRSFLGSPETLGASRRAKGGSTPSGTRRGPRRDRRGRNWRRRDESVDRRPSFTIEGVSTRRLGARRLDLAAGRNPMRRRAGRIEPDRKTSAARSAQGSRTGRMRIILRFFGFLFSIGAIAFLIAAAGGGYFYWKYSQDLPDHAQLATYEPPVMTRVHAGDGSLLAEYARERRLYLPIQAVPKQVIGAFLSAEDKNFYKHNGVDPEGVIRALVTNFQRGKKQGASTITQQVAKNFLLTNEQTFTRKIREALIALRIEAAFSKDRILELYLNEIFLGLCNYGIAAAALNYFGKSVHELTLAESAYLAALPKAPNNYHPFRQKQAAVERRNWVIDRMVDNGYVKREEADKAKR